jgi:HlyD family secretion protein
MKSKRSGKALWLAIFFLMTAITILLVNSIQSAQAESVNGEEKKVAVSDKAVPVKLTELVSRNFADSISVYGKIEATYRAYVSPRISGTLEQIMVDEGDYVEKDKTVLFQTDNIKLEQKVRAARQSLEMVKAVEKERKALLQKAEVDMQRKKKNYDRHVELLSKSAVAQATYDTVEADYLSAVAEVEQKKAFYTLCLEEAKQALINLEMAKKDFSDSTVLAPINGFICERLLDQGEMGEPGKPVFKIENVSVLDISAFIPAEFSDCFVQNQTEAEITLHGKKLSEKVKVTYVSPVVDAKLHVFEVKCRITDNKALKPGESVQLKFNVAQRRVLATPSDSVMQDESGWIVFVPDNDHAKKVCVEKGEEKDGWIEISGAGLQEGTRIISEGQSFISDKSLIRIIE